MDGLFLLYVLAVVIGCMLTDGLNVQSHAEGVER